MNPREPDLAFCEAFAKSPLSRSSLKPKWLPTNQLIAYPTNYKTNELRN